MPLFIDLFCGAGGFTTGLKAAGWQHVVGVEYDPVFAATYAANHKHVLCKDISKVTLSDLQPFVKGRKVDLIAASPPCMSFSSLGLKAQGDERDLLYKQAIRIAKLLNVPLVAVENVTGILVKKQGMAQTSFAEQIVKDYSRAGYNMRVAVLDASQYGAPQRRRRVFFIGARRPAPAPLFPLPLKSYDPAVGRVLLPEAQVPEKYYLSAHRVANFLDRTARVQARGSGWKMQVMDPAKPAFTLTSSYWSNSGYYNLVRTRRRHGYRMMTPREAANVMGFPRSYKFVAQTEDSLYRTIGNAVCPPLARHVGVALLRQLAETGQKH